jgi:hypothetical protein
MTGDKLMYMRMITYHLKDDVAQNVASSVYDDIVAELKQQDGFQGSALLFDEDVGTAVSLSYWSDAECAGIAGEHILPVLFERTSELSDRPPEIAGYHVLDHHLLQQ